VLEAVALAEGHGYTSARAMRGSRTS
jgi:hypothetical protein